MNGRVSRKLRQLNIEFNQDLVSEGKLLGLSKSKIFNNPLIRKRYKEIKRTYKETFSLFMQSGLKGSRLL